MYAKPGDWLIVEIVGTDNAVRRAMIEEVRSPDGAPPFTVRWLDTDREGLVFPGADAHVLTQAELDELDARLASRSAGIRRTGSSRTGIAEVEGKEDQPCARETS